jgi:LIM homeobox transcription factor 1
MCSLDTSLDGSNFDNLDEASDSMSLQNLDLHASSLQLDHHNHHNNNNTSTTNLMTHIDKLYLMQNSYFNGQPLEQN